MKGEFVEKSAWDRLKMTGELKGNKLAITETLDVIKEMVQRTNNEAFWLKFEVEGMKQ